MADNGDAGSDLHPYGAGSHGLLDDDREMPACYPIKGNVRNDGTKLYHRPDSRNYGATVPEVWFDSPSAAEAAGFELAPTHPRGSTGAAYEPGRSGHPCTAEQVMSNRAAAPGGAMAGAGFVLAAAAADGDLHPHGIGSHGLLDDDREMPGCYPIKGNVRNDGSKLYHRPDSRSYAATKAEVWFDSPSAAEAAGFELAPTHPRGSTGAAYEPGRSGHPCTAAEVNENRAASAGMRIAGLPTLARVVLGAEAVDIERHPSGIGSHAVLDDVDEMPDCYPIKGNVRNDGSKLYHRPDSRSYAATKAEVWFDSPSAAEAAGFVLAPTHSRDSSAAAYEPGGSGHPCTVDQVDANRAGAAGVALDDRGRDDDDSSAVGPLGLAGAAGAAAVAGAALAGTGGDREPDGRASSSVDDVAGPSGDALADAAGRAAGPAATAATRGGGGGGDEPSGAGDGDSADRGGDAAAGSSSVDDVAGPSGDALADAAGRASGPAAAAGAGAGDDGGEDDEGGRGVAGAAGATAAAAAAAGVAAAGGSDGGDGDGGDEPSGAGEGETSGTGGKAAAAGAAGAAARAAASARNREEIERGIASARANVDSRADKVPGQPRTSTASAATATATERPGAALAGRTAPAGGGGGFGLGRWLWMGLGLLALVLLLGWLLSRCGDDETTGTAGGDGSEQTALAGPGTDSTGASAGEEGAATAGGREAEDTTPTTEPATTTTAATTTTSEAATTTQAESTTTTQAPDLQALVSSALADAGYEGVEVEVDGDTVRLAGELASEDERTAAEAAVAALSDVGSVANEITVAGETPAADATDGDPRYTG